MTVAAQLKQPMASLKGSMATLEAFALYSEVPEAKATLERNIRKINSVVEGFEDRLKTVELEEPQYKGF